MIRAIVFDFDGLIIDTESADYHSWVELYQSYGCDLPFSVWEAVIGKGNDHITFDPCVYLEEQLKRAVDHAAVRTARRTRLLDMVAAQPILPGVENYLAEAKHLGLKIGLASSSGCEWVKGNLTRVGLIHHFDCIRCADDVKHTKPDPELYLAVLSALDVQPQEAIALEDSANGALAAKRAGMCCVAVPNAMTHKLNFDHVDFRLNSMLDIPLSELIAQVEARQ
ncbi:MAG: HAD family hydrolase [Anaerolineae bacterium]|nr:HAD family hydrolase [Anaerolineae bacterium]